MMKRKRLGDYELTRKESVPFNFDTPSYLFKA